MSVSCMFDTYVVEGKGGRFRERFRDRGRGLGERERFRERGRYLEIEGEV